MGTYFNAAETDTERLEQLQVKGQNLARQRIMGQKIHGIIQGRWTRQ